MAGHDSAPLTLALDTSSPTLSLALGRAGEALCSRQGSARSTSRLLFELLDSCMSEVGYGRDALGEIRVVLGPGSFTGLRIGLSFALGLHQSLGLPVRGVGTSTLLAFALVEDHVEGPGTSAIHALNEDWFVQEWSRLPTLEPAGEIVRRRWGAAEPERNVIATSHASQLPEELAESTRIISTEIMAGLLLRLPANSLVAIDQTSWEPLYLSPPPVHRSAS